MRNAGYALASALSFQLLLNVGAVAGGLLGATIADRYGSRLVAVGAFLLATTSVAVMASAPPTGVLALATIGAGAGSIGTQIILFGYVATYYKTAVRATALGLATGVGRLGAVCGPSVGGWLIASGLGNVWMFAFFSVTAVVGAMACFAVPRRGRRPAGQGAEVSTISAA